ncbi:hypothetical protein SAMN05421736_11659 [Evansella caseinilytica]|uniref:Uncharacterized protein n=1 Tax=Evansella caseinilytica TaxID=1503961 RepID=A0A1H3TUF4_9BACI|nr:hypothetical protein [Evansella caseinilytica]SDZ53826.1 hypothetical protein SAMN05421736_11659 [Evansella caseinilytica]
MSRAVEGQRNDEIRRRYFPNCDEFTLKKSLESCCACYSRLFLLSVAQQQRMPIIRTVTPFFKEFQASRRKAPANRLTVPLHASATGNFIY